MPAWYFIHKEQRLVLSIGRGRLTTQDIADHRGRLLGDPGFNQEFNQLIDMTDVTHADISAEEIRWLASRSVFSPSSRRAYVITQPVLFGIARQFEAYHGQRAEVHVFYDWDSALKWLGLSDISSALSAGQSAAD